MTTQTLTSIVIIAVLIVAVFVTAFRLFKAFYLLKEVKTRLNLETEQKEHYKKKLAASPTRQEFIEQSEMATSWRQKHDRLAVQAELLHNDFVKIVGLLEEAEQDTQAKYVKYCEDNDIKEYGVKELAGLIRSINSLKYNECIKVSNDFEKKEIDKLLEAEHVEKSRFLWRKTKYDPYKPLDFVYPVEYPCYLCLRGEKSLKDIFHEHLFELENYYVISPYDFFVAKKKIEKKNSLIGLNSVEEISSFFNDANKDVPEIDWSEPQPFPSKYEVPKGIKCKYIKRERSISLDVLPIGTIGKTNEKDVMPEFLFKLDGRENDRYVFSHNLAPLDPTDHPLHPDFNPSKYNDQQ